MALWFKRKTYGWGWTPVTWQGWLVLIFYIALMFLNFMRLDAISHSASDTVRPFVIQSALLTALLIAICYKTGEKPRWQWGERTEDTA